MSAPGGRGPGGRDEDDALLDELRGLADRFDPVPDRVRDAARAAYTWRTIDAELLELTRDSAVERAEPALRATTGPRLLVFAYEPFTIELEVTSDPERRVQLVGQIVPAVRAEIEVQQEGASRRTESDRLGRFLIDGLSPGPARLRCRFSQPSGERSLTTEWTQL